MTDYPYTILPLLESSGSRILELGARHYSTPLVHYLTLARACTAYTYDSEAYKIEQFSFYYQRECHQFETCDWKDIPLKRHWDIVLLNHDIPHDDRQMLLERVAWWTKYVVVVSGSDDAFPQYRYRLDTRTTILSNLRVLS